MRGITTGAFHARIRHSIAWRRHRDRQRSRMDAGVFQRQEEAVADCAECGKPALYRCYTRRGEAFGYCAAHKALAGGGFRF